MSIGKGLTPDQFRNDLPGAFDEMNRMYWGDNPKDWAPGLTAGEIDALWRRYWADGSKGISWQGLREELSRIRGGNLGDTSDPNLGAYLKKVQAQGPPQGAQDPTQQQQQQPGQPVSPDVQNAIDTIGKDRPDLAAAIDAALQGGAATDNVSLFPNLGVDPNASVYGVVGKPKRALGPPGSEIQHMAPVEYASRQAQDWLKDLYRMSPQELLALQQNMYDQGWYAGTKIKDRNQLTGSPDPETLKAYGEVLGETARYNAAAAQDANGQWMTWSGVLAMGAPYKDTALAGAGTGGPYAKTNPADLASTLKAQAQQELGRAPTAAELKQFQDQFIAEEDAARKQMAAAAANNQTVGVTDVGSPSTRAEQFIDTHDLTDKMAYGAAVRQQAFFSMLKSPT